MLYEQAERKGLASQLIRKIERILSRLDVRVVRIIIDLPGFRLHPLKGRLQGFWSVSVSGNWRIYFRFKEGNVTDVDLIDYH